MSVSIDTELTLQAVKNAIKLQIPDNPLILHSNLGSQQTSLDFKKYILNTKIIIHSFKAKGCSYDNAYIESFHASLKKEEINLVKYFDFNATKLAVLEYIESWYNRKKFMAASAI